MKISFPPRWTRISPTRLLFFALSYSYPTTHVLFCGGAVKSHHLWNFCCKVHKEVYSSAFLSSAERVQVLTLSEQKDSKLTDNYIYFFQLSFKFVDLFLELLRVFYTQLVQKVLLPVKVIVILSFKVVLRVLLFNNQMLTKWIFWPFTFELIDTFKHLWLNSGDAVIKSRMLGLRSLSFPE